MAQVHESIAKVMKDIDAIGKDKKNTQQGFAYRGIDDVMNAVHSLMADNSLLVVPEFIDGIREERQTRSGGTVIYSVCDYRFTVYASDGSSVSGIVRGEGMDSGDKASNKAISVALKYFLLQLFMIPTEELKDPDAESHQIIAQPTIDDKLIALPEDVKAYLKASGMKKSEMVTWCNHYAWDDNAMLVAVHDTENKPD